MARVVRRAGIIAGALALSLVAGRAARADAVIYDADRYDDVATKLVVRGLGDLGDVVLVVYPYPCVAAGAFSALEAELRRDSDAALEGREEGERGYLVVREGEAFASASGYEGPLYNCFFFGLPRAAFPEQDGAIARLDALSDGARWSLLSRDPDVLRTGVPLALAGLARSGAGVPQEREVEYAARLVGGRLMIEAVQWTWKHADGATQVEDPRKLSRRRRREVEPHADRSDDEEAAWFAGGLVRAGKDVAATTRPQAQGGSSGPEPLVVADEAGPRGQETTSGPAASVVALETGSEGHVDDAGAREQRDVGPAGSAASEPATASAPVQADSWDRGLVYGVMCLVVAAGAALLLRRGGR